MDIEDETPPKDSSEQDSPVEATPKSLSKKQLRWIELRKKSRESAGYEHEWFLHYRRCKTNLVFYTVTGEVRARLSYFSIFCFTLDHTDQKEPIVLQKLHTLYISESKCRYQIKEYLKVHQPTKDKGLVPQPGTDLETIIPADLVAKSITEKEQLALMLTNGTIIIGVPICESKYSLVIELPEAACNQQIVVFKHAIVGLRLYADIKPSEVKEGAS